MRFPKQDWIDDHDMTGSYVGSDKYEYCLGQSHSIDDFDDESVWFYITMVKPLNEMEEVIELEDIMPFVFWWENRGVENNGPDVDCYGKASSAKLNYEKGGWCYSNAHETAANNQILDNNGRAKDNWERDVEHRWHAVQHTLGTDFSRHEYGGTILTTDNSGNTYKGAFDPNCVGTDEKWKIHNVTNAFGANQHEDPTEDKFYYPYEAHGDGKFNNATVPSAMNTDILGSMQNRPMVWNLWNVVRHYAYLKHFKNKHRELGSDEAAWQELELITKKLVKAIYRTFKEKQKTGTERNTFGDIDGINTLNK